MKYAPGGHSSFFGFINSFVHIPMYLYYGLAAIGPHMNKYLFWKKYMTSLQMVRHCFILCNFCERGNVPVCVVSQSIGRWLMIHFTFEGFRAVIRITFTFLSCFFHLSSFIMFIACFYFILPFIHSFSHSYIYVSFPFSIILVPIDSIRCHFRALISIAISRL